MASDDLFQQRYTLLNDRQKEAVNTIYGPVMVIAGPGTGKTEVLSMRIANLLGSEAQVQPHEILCLTYTDEATNSMRRRLVQIIGPAAHRVNIHTFHGFCNNVIQNNSEYFSIRNLQPIDDLERTEMLYDILEKLPKGHILRRLSGNIYTDAGKIHRLLDFMKRENYRAKDIADAVDLYIQGLPEKEEYIYKKAYREYKKGDLKQDKLDEEIKRMQATKAAAELFDTYEARMQEAGRYDFNDMILWVLDAFKTHPFLLQSYQERHQFILVDEFQDTNGSQNDLLNMLAEFWEDPNIFVVGDDDQSIYEFQGARIRNIIDFYERYKETIKIIVLPENYRSSQAILDKSGATIMNNRQRLIYQLQHLELNKDIVASAKRFLEKPEDTVAPLVNVYNNILQEEAHIIYQVEQLQKQGIALNNVAILYAQHRQAENIMALMERKGIPYSVKKSVNILELPLILQIINVITYLEEERKQPFSQEALLFEIMHAPYYEIDSTDIAALSLYIQANKSKDRSLGYWRLLLTNDLLLESLNLGTAKALRRLGQCVTQWQRQQPSLSLPLLVEKIVYESGIVAYLVKQKDHAWQVQVLHTFFEFVKEMHSRNNRITAAELLKMLGKMQAEKIAMPVQRVIQNEHGVQFYTTHGAKGNEFEYVFLIGATKNFWEAKKGGNNDFKLPDTITNTEDDTEKTYKTEVARRLFYVALTRAKKFLTVSFALNDNAGKSIEASVFVDEISKPEERKLQALDSEALVAHMAWAMSPVPDVKIKLANAQAIERILQQLTMSYTTLSKFLHCPLEFYYESILRVPFQKGDALAFGSAVHYALEKMFRDMKATTNNEFPTKEQVIAFFNSALYSESGSFTEIQFERRLEQGHNILSEYYDEYINGFSKNVEIEMKIPRYILDGVPVTGKIDKIEIGTDGSTCTVIDYKTGNPDRAANAMTAPPNEKDPMGGDYWRQMVFYKLIMENYQEKNWRVNTGIFDFIQKGDTSNKYKRITIPMYEADEAEVMRQLKDSYSRIMNHEFDRGCGKEDCHWCNFAKRYELIRPAKDAFVEIDDV